MINLHVIWHVLVYQTTKAVCVGQSIYTKYIHFHEFLCDHNNNTIIIVKYHVLDFTRLLTLVCVAGRNPLYT